MSSAAAQEPVATASAAKLDADGAEAFADDLLRHGDPFNALTFYKLQQHLSDERSASIGFRAALCYELGDRFAASEEAYLDLAGRYPDWSARATWRAAMSARADHRSAEAALHLSDVVLEGQGTDLGVRAKFMTAVVALDAHNLALADGAFESFLAAHPEHSLAARAVASRELLADRVPRRSPALAGVLSTVVPGAGQLYAGHPGDAVMAVLSSGVLGLWSYSLLRTGIEDSRGWRVGVGAALGTVATFTWTSNVFGAVRGARRTNSYLRKRRADEVLRETADPLLQADAEDVLRDSAIFD